MLSVICHWQTLAMLADFKRQPRFDCPHQRPDLCFVQVQAVSREHKDRRLSDRLSERAGAQHMHAAHPRVKHGQQDLYSRH